MSKQDAIAKFRSLGDQVKELQKEMPNARDFGFGSRLDAARQQQRDRIARIEDERDALVTSFKAGRAA